MTFWSVQIIPRGALQKGWILSLIIEFAGVAYGPAIFTMIVSKLLTVMLEDARSHIIPHSTLTKQPKMSPENKVLVKDTPNFSLQARLHHACYN